MLTSNSRCAWGHNIWRPWQLSCNFCARETSFSPCFHQVLLCFRRVFASFVVISSFWLHSGRFYRPVAPFLCGFLHLFRVLAVADSKDLQFRAVNRCVRPFGSSRAALPARHRCEPRCSPVVLFARRRLPPSAPCRLAAPVIRRAAASRHAVADASSSFFFVSFVSLVLMYEAWVMSRSL